MSDKLKPCPFCGADAKIIKSEDTDSSLKYIFTVQCSNPFCGISYECSRKDVAIKLWNKRVQNER